MITNKVLGVFVSVSLFCVSQISYADWQDDYNSSAQSSEVLQEKAAQEFYAQDHIIKTPHKRKSYNNPPREYYQSERTPRVTRSVKTYESDETATAEEIYSKGLPAQVATREKVIIVDPVAHSWAAYSANGKLMRAGLATAGAKWCPDIGRPCKTKVGVFRIYSLGSEDCVSSIYPIDEGGGAPMPYCMYFNGSQGLHGSDHVVRGNISHGCVRLRESDARWIRYNFATHGTKVIIKPY